MTDATAEIASKHSNQATELDALVIGAGFAGLYQLLSLRERLGLSVKALEAGGGVGGTCIGTATPALGAIPKVMSTGTLSRPT
jgi:pyruvate/2-oxoglutarate dehydrogenase complex dihydrolipoamide dehydrogenase (E3) component